MNGISKGLRLSLIVSILCLLFLNDTPIYVEYGNHPFFKLENRLKKGDKRALYRLADKFDSDKKVKVFFSGQEFEITESELAKKVIEENCFFMESEIMINESITKNQFRDFLKSNHNRIIFSDLANAFIITPFEQRNADFKIRELPDVRKDDLKDVFEKLIVSDWVKENGIDTLIKSGNPLCLLKIASEMFKSRNETYYFEDYVFLVQCLTGTQIAVESADYKLVWQIEKEYSDIAKLNFLIYFTRHYADYAWNEQINVFVNPLHDVMPIERENSLFYLLGSKNDSIAIDAFIQLTTCNKEKVIELCSEYDEMHHHETNFYLPTFPFRFLEQLVVLTDYCRENKIDFAGSKKLPDKIKQMKTRMPFAERYKLENDLIATLTPDEITALEYWSLVYEEYWTLPLSAGRIVDVFYSRNWNKILENPKYLDCYLKKSKLFEELGIVGICNSYLKKFSNSSDKTLTLLKNHQSKDNDVKEQIGKILNAAPLSCKKGVVTWIGNHDKTVDSLDIKLSETLRKKDAQKATELISMVTYQQIPIAFEYIEKFPDCMDVRYDFMYSDFGFVSESFSKKEVRDEFLKLHSTRSEYDVYSYYLDKTDIDYKNSDYTLNYDKIYEMLKYDVVEALAGATMSRYNQVYLLIKLLELTFDTTLGYPRKLCNSQNVWGCDANDRAKDWMEYLIEHSLLEYKHDEPVSFHY